MIRKISKPLCVDSNIAFTKDSCLIEVRILGFDVTVSFIDEKSEYTVI